MSQDWGNQQPGQGGNPPWQQPGSTPPWAQPGATPPWAPGAGGGLPPGQRPPSKKPVGLIVAAIAAVVVVGGIVALVASGGGDDDERSSSTDRQSSQSDDTDDTQDTDDTDDTQGTDDTDDTQGTDDTDDTQGTGGTQTGTDGDFVLGVTVSHPFPGDLGVRLEVYDADDQLLCGADLWEPTGQDTEEQTILLDPTECADFYPPGPDQRWFVGVFDLATQDEGTLDEVAIIGPDGDFYVAFGLPLSIPDADTNGVYVELTTA